MKLYKYILMLAIGALFTGCYNKFDEVPTLVTYDSEEAFTRAFPDCQKLTIEELKQLYATKTGDSNFVGGENSSWANTKCYKVEEDVYIRGKVISNDEEGNIYKSLYLLDESGAIEVRLTTGNYLKYNMGDYDHERAMTDETYKIEIPSTYVYVRVKGLVIGNYRMMLSIGAGPTDSFNKRDEHKFYANSAIDNLKVISEHVFVGEKSTLKEGEDIPVIDETNYATINGQGGRTMFGRLILFKNIKCLYAGVADQKGQTASGIGDNIFPSWLYTENMKYSNGILTKPWYNLAYSRPDGNLYGSVLFAYLSTPPTNGIAAGAFSLRTSGYSRFSGRTVLRNGAKGNLLALYSIYSKSWTYSYGAYQLAVSRYEDILFDKNDFLSADQVEAMTPEGTTDGTYQMGGFKDNYYYVYNNASGKVEVRDMGESADDPALAESVYPTFFTHYTEEGFDKFVNYPAYSALPSAIAFLKPGQADDATSLDYYVVKVENGAVALDTVSVAVANNAFDFAGHEKSCFNVARATSNKSAGRYTFEHDGKYLAIVGKELVLSDTPYVWVMSMLPSKYDKEKDSYYVSWVGEEDDNGGSQE